MPDSWNNAYSYESYIGRWSRLVAPEFLKWVEPQPALAWLDVGCGTGALSEAILRLTNPAKITAIDPSASHIAFAKEHFASQDKTRFFISDAENIPLKMNAVDAIASGLVLNFITDINKALIEFRRVCRNGGMVSGYVWDYAGRMEMLRYFWDAAVSLSEKTREKDEAIRFPLCNTVRLKELFEANGFKDVETTLMDVPTLFRNFDEFWSPFLSGQGPAPAYCMSLTEDERDELKRKTVSCLPVQKDGSIHLIARAIGVKGRNQK